ncbi:PIG-L family deacetylase [Nitratireductor sp. XY-223]|uniref:PIG-L family deacetylase n=1 Tax=Nitratireductor sp. XY-223 TaxID=2561926 RepID=UPI0010A9D097|nr:PIG-L family deacetylase [Nitratireductor sp. XY-223]
MATDDLLSNSVIIAAHPDDELLWFGAILKKVDRVIMVYEDFWPNPEVGNARAAVLDDYPRAGVTSLRIAEAATHSCADWNDPKLSEYGIELGFEATKRDLKQSVKRLLGKSRAPRGGINAHYKQNFERVYTALKPLLMPEMNVFTHNPWGEYGHEDHIQVFRAVDRLRGEIGFTQWMTNYCTDRSLPLAMTYTQDDNRDYIQFPVDGTYADTVADVYRKHGCWTWADNWRWFPFELYCRAPRQQSGGGLEPGLLPLNLFKFAA